MYKHGMEGSKIYNIWKGMNGRCRDKSNSSYCRYGENGITVCEKWKNSFIDFYNWSMDNGYEEGLSIDRIDNKQGYSENNCRWATRSVQSSNTRLIHSDNTSGYRGVSYYNGKWKSQIQYEKKKIYIGLYETKLDAAMQYDKFVYDNNFPHTTNHTKEKVLQWMKEYQEQ